MREAKANPPLMTIRLQTEFPQACGRLSNFGHGPLPVIDTAIQGEAEDVTDAA